MLTGEDYKTFMRMAADALQCVSTNELHALLAAASDPLDAFGKFRSLGQRSVETACIAAAATIATELERRRREL